MPRVKSTTFTLADAPPAAAPFACTVALFVSNPVAVGVKFTLTVAVAPMPSVPIEQVTVAFTTVVQAPGVLLMDANVAPLMGKLSTKIRFVATAEVLFLMV
jgi:hypothetical protein